MLLKRHYRFPEGWKADRNVFVDAQGATYDLPLRDALRLGIPLKLRDPSKDPGTILNLPPVSHFTVEHTGTHAEQNFTEETVRAWLASGAAQIADGKLTLRTEDGQPDLEYTIKRVPGHYCCHCGAELEDANVVRDGVSGGTLHVRTHAVDGKVPKSPDPSNPAGYERLNHYECVLDAKQHEQFKASAPTLDLLKAEG